MGLWLRPLEPLQRLQARHQVPQRGLLLLLLRALPQAALLQAALLLMPLATAACPQAHQLADQPVLLPAHQLADPARVLLQRQGRLLPVQHLVQQPVRLLPLLAAQQLSAPPAQGLLALPPLLARPQAAGQGRAHGLHGWLPLTCLHP